MLRDPQNLAFRGKKCKIFLGEMRKQELRVMNVSPFMIFHVTNNGQLL